MLKFRLFWQNNRWALMLCSAVLLLVLVGVLTQVAAADVSAEAALEITQDDPPPVPEMPFDYWSYSVKIVCDDEFEHQRNTIINIFNPSYDKSTLVMGVALTVIGNNVVRPAVPPAVGSVPVTGLNPVTMLLPGLNATAIDCDHIGPTPVLTEGFVTIFSEKPLDIVAVYMSSFNHENGEGQIDHEDENVEVEHVPGRYVSNGAAQPNGWEQP